MILYNQKPLLGKLPLWTPNPMGIPAPVGAWAMNEGSGEKLYDLSLNENNGTINCSFPWSKPEGIYFDGDNDFASISQSVIPQSEFSIVFREYTPNTNTGYFMSDSTDPGNLFLRRPTNNNHMYIEFGIGDSYYSTISCPYQQVNDLVLNHFSGGLWDVYVNGLLAHSDSGSNFTALQSNLYLGNRQDLARDFEGILYYVYIFKKTLSFAQIAYLHQHPYYAWEYPELWKYYVAAAGGVSPTANIYGPLYGPLAGVI